MNLFSKIAQSPTFVAFNAHAGFAFFFMAVAAVHAFVLWHVLFIMMPAFAIKEFYVDVRFEQDPPQTYMDGAVDLLGYLTGLALAAWLMPWSIR